MLMECYRVPMLTPQVKWVRAVLVLRYITIVWGTEKYQNWSTWTILMYWKYGIWFSLNLIGEGMTGL